MIGPLLSLMIGVAVSQTEAPTSDTSAYRDIVRCHGVLNNGRQQLSERDRRQIGIAAALTVIDGRLEGLVSAGVVNEAQLVLDLQNTINETVATFEPALEGCSATYAEVEATEAPTTR